MKRESSVTTTSKGEDDSVRAALQSLLILLFIIAKTNASSEVVHLSFPIDVGYHPDPREEAGTEPRAKFGLSHSA